MCVIPYMCLSCSIDLVLKCANKKNDIVVAFSMRS